MSPFLRAQRAPTGLDVGVGRPRIGLSEFSSAVGPAWRNGQNAHVAKRTTILKVSGLRRAFGPNTIFDRFNLEVRTGEAIALTGRNGAGKSTLLRCLVGADRPDDGTVEVCGNAMRETSPEIRRDVATVIDDLDFFPDLSVVEHLDLLARAHGISEPDALVDEVLDEVQLVPQSGQLPGTLSSGQRRRLALATALVRPRELLPWTNRSSGWTPKGSAGSRAGSRPSVSRAWRSFSRATSRPWWRRWLLVWSSWEHHAGEQRRSSRGIFRSGAPKLRDAGAGDATGAEGHDPRLAARSSHQESG